MKPYAILFATLTPLAAYANDEPPVEVHMEEDESDELYPSKAQDEAPKEACEHDGPSFWHKPDGARRGDFLLTWSGGSGPTGGFGGAQAEWLFSDHVSLRLGGLFDGLDREHAIEGNKFSGWSYASGAWAGLDARQLASTTHGMVALIEPSLAYHFRPGEKLDIYATAGISGFVYLLDDDRVGGSALVRTGIGAQYFWHALFVGAEVGWYPIELARVSGHFDVYLVSQPDDRFDPRRATFVAHVGLRL